MSQVVHDGLTHAYLELGDPALPPLVLLHGLHGDGATVRPVAERLAGRFHVVAPDALGHGRTTRPAGGYTVRDQAAALDGLLATLGFGAVPLVGISMGSYVAAQTAVAFPSRVSHLVLVTSRAVHDERTSPAGYAAQRGVDLASATREQAAAVLADAMWAPTTPPARRAALTALVAPSVTLSADERRAADRSLAGFDVHTGLPTVAAPTLVLSGRWDGINPPSAGAEVARLVPGARFVVYEDSAHRLPYEELDRFVADVAAFLDGRKTADAYPRAERSEGREVR